MTRLALRRAAVAFTSAVVVTLLPASPAARAQVSTWNNKQAGAVIGGDWKTAKNWTKGVPDGAKAEAVFPDGLAGNVTIALDKQYQLITLTMESTDATRAYTFQSDGGGKGSLKFLMNPNNMGLNGMIPIITVESGNKANNTIALPVLIDDKVALQITNDSDAGTGRLTISGVISGPKAEGLVVDGTGEVLLSGVNTFVGTTKIEGGNVSIVKNSGLGNPKNSVELLNGGVLRGLQGASVGAAREITLGDAVGGSSGTLAGDTAKKMDGTPYVFVVNSKITSPALGGSEFLGILEHVRLTNEKNDFKVTDGILIGSPTQQGFLRVGSDKVMGDASNKIVIRSPGTLVAVGTFTSARAVNLDPNGRIRVVTGETLTLTGVVSGTGILTKDGAGTLELKGKNTYGRTVIDAGVLAVSSNDNLGKAGRPIGINNGAVLQVNAPFETDRAINIKNSGEIAVNFPRDPKKGGDFKVTGKISGGELIKSGPGFLTLTNTKNEQTQTTINGGSVAVAKDGVLGPSTAPLVIRNGAAIEVIDSFSTSRKIMVATAKGGVIHVNKGETFTVDSGINGTISRFDKSGAGTLVLDKGSTSSVGRDVRVLDGILQIDGTLKTGSGLLNEKGTEVAGSGEVQGNFDNKGKVKPGGDPGTLTVTGDVVMEPDSHFGFNINSAKGSPGGVLGWGLLSVGGQLNLLGTTTIDLQTFDLSGNPGPLDPSQFDPHTPYSWEFASAQGGIVGFDPSHWLIDESGFLNSHPGEAFSVTQMGNGLFLQLSTVPEPSPPALAAVALAGLACASWWRRTASPRSAAPHVC
jgi:autotransporter-associated beta strand protein